MAIPRIYSAWPSRWSGPARLDRLLLILALAYLLLLAVGLLALARLSPAHWSSSTRGDAASLFRIGQWAVDDLGLPLQAIHLLVQQLQRQVPKWG